MLFSFPEKAATIEADLFVFHQPGWPGWPQQPPTEKLLKLNLIFHDSTKKLCFSKHQNNIKIS